MVLHCQVRKRVRWVCSDVVKSWRQSREAVCEMCVCGLRVWLAGLSFLCCMGVVFSDEPAALVQTVAGTGERGPYLAASGQALQTAVNEPFGLSMREPGVLYVCEVGGHVIRRVDLSTGKTAVVAGTGEKGYAGDGGLATSAKLNEPYEVRFDRDGSMYFVEMQNHVVRRVDAATGIISTVAGTGVAGFSGDGGAATAAQLRQPHSIALDGAGTLYICDIGNHRVRAVDLKTGVMRTFAGTGERRATVDGAPIAGTPLNGPRALDYDGQGSLYLALREGNALYRMDLQKGTLQHLAGTGKSGYGGDGGPAREALLSGPKGVAVGPDGNVYFADTESHTVRVYVPSEGVVRTVVGNGQKGDGPDGAPLQCRMDRLHGVYVSPDGVLYIGDSNNHRVRALRLASGVGR